MKRITMNKSVFKSKTFWFGIIMAVAPIFPVVEKLLVDNPNILSTAAGVITIFLRYKTNTAIG